MGLEKLPGVPDCLEPLRPEWAQSVPRSISLRLGSADDNKTSMERGIPIPRVAQTFGGRDWNPALQLSNGGRVMRRFICRYPRSR